MSQKKNPGSAGTPHGAGKDTSVVSDATYHQKKRPDIDAIWGACREALDAAAERKAQADAKLEAAALALDFRQIENGRWTQQCPHCGRRVSLFLGNDGKVHASSDGVPRCHAFPSIEQLLEGFES